MNLRNVSLMSLSRQKGKKAFVLAAMILGCATVVSLFTFVNTQRRSIEDQFDQYGANIVILPRSDTLTLSYGGVSVSGVVANVREIKRTDIDRIWDIPNRDNIRAVSAKLLGRVEVSAPEAVAEVLLVGVDFEAELRVKSWWEVDGRVPTTGGEVIVGFDAAKKLGIDRDESILIAGERMQVAGVLSATGSQDDQVLFANYDFVASLLGKPDVVSLAEVSALCSDCPIEQITEQLSKALPNANVREIRQVMQQKMQTVAQVERFAVTTSVVIGFIGTVLVFTSMMGSVSDRKHEIGILRAIGYRKQHIVSIILAEGFILGVAAGLIGSLAGYGISYVALPALMGMASDALVLKLGLAGAVLPGVVLVGLVAALYPAFKAAKIDPIITLNSI